jgi:hypothetical protein
MKVLKGMVCCFAISNTCSVLAAKSKVPKVFKYYFLAENGREHKKPKKFAMARSR